MFTLLHAKFGRTDQVWLAKHDVVGAKMLREVGFSDRLSRLVEGHVQAKRYLTFKEDKYFENLSEGSKFTLKHQVRLRVCLCLCLCLCVSVCVCVCVPCPPPSQAHPLSCPV